MMSVGRSPGKFLRLAGVVALTVTVGCHLSPGSTTALSSPLPPSASVSGIVLDQSTRLAVSGASITLVPADTIAGTGSGLGSRTDARGSFRIEPIVPGSYTLLVSARGYKTAMETVHFAPSQSRIRRFQLVPLAACPTTVAGRKGPGCP